MKNIYVNCGVKNYMNEDHPSWLVSLIVERCTGIAEVKGSNPVQARYSFQAFFSLPAKVVYATAMIFTHVILHSCNRFCSKHQATRSFG